MRPELIEIRRQKVARLRELGVNPYPYSFRRTMNTAGLLDGFDARIDGDPVAVAGRLMAIRPMGKAVFAHLQDEGGRIQLYFKKDEIGEAAFAILELLDLGDIVGVVGVPMRTRTGEATLSVRSFQLLCKTLRPLPSVKEKDGQTFDAWEDVEARYRRRYVDLILHPERRRVFEARARLITGLRRYLDERGFLEVETPVLQAIYGGAMARPFTTHHNALDMRLFLRIAEELPLKKLLVGGFERVYEIGRVFRNEGMDRNHNPEFTMLEFYWAYADYRDAMDLVEDMVRAAVTAAAGSNVVDYNGHAIDLGAPFARRSMVELIQECTGVDVLTAPVDALRALLIKGGVTVAKFAERGHMIEALFDLAVCPKLVQPTFVTDHPLAISPLAKVHRDRPTELAERFELFIDGREFGNSFSELNDPIDQRRRFEDQARLREAGDDEAQVLDEDFLEAIETGMPPAAGVGIGIDRLAMLASGAPSIRDVLLFPHMRPEEGRATSDESGDA
ncbi:MAG: lysine--tRNA ligase [Candidatus Eisenbacteria bacterium]|nr:lysine--tRNA ligase [Candidatus Eisenbacteria bacterium]